MSSNLINPYLFNPEYDGSSFKLTGSSIGLLLFHGFSATTLEVRGLAEYINNNLGWTVEAPLLPGHGTTPVDLSHTVYKEWLFTAESVLKYLKQITNTIVVGGESMGGLLSLYLAARYPEITGVLLYAPALVTPGMQKARLMKYYIFSSPKKNLAAKKPGYLPWQGYKVNPLKAVAEMGYLQNKVKNLLPSVKQPIIIFQGKQDTTIDLKSSQIIYKSVSSKEKDLVELDDCGHCILLDKQYGSVYERTISFLKSLSEGNIV